MLSEISNTQREILHDFIYTWNLKNVECVEAESRTVVTKGGEMGKCWLKNTKLQLCRSLEI